MKSMIKTEKFEPKASEAFLSFRLACLEFFSLRAMQICQLKKKIESLVLFLLLSARFPMAYTQPLAPRETRFTVAAMRRVSVSSSYTKCVAIGIEPESHNRLTYKDFRQWNAKYRGYRDLLYRNQSIADRRRRCARRQARDILPVNGRTVAGASSWRKWQPQSNSCCYLTTISPSNIISVAEIRIECTFTTRKHVYWLAHWSNAIILVDSRRSVPINRRW